MAHAPQLSRNDAPHRPAAFISALAEEGTKAEAIEWLQKIWNDLCQAETEIRRLKQLRAEDTIHYGEVLSEEMATRSESVERMEDEMPLDPDAIRAEFNQWWASWDKAGLSGIDKEIAFDAFDAAAHRYKSTPSAEGALEKIIPVDSPDEAGGPDWVCIGCGAVNECRTIKYDTPGEPVDYDLECNACGCREFEEGYHSALRRVLDQRDRLQEKLDALSSATGARDELIAIHYAALNPMEVKPQEGDTLTVRLVKQFIQRAAGTGPFSATPLRSDVRALVDAVAEMFARHTEMVEWPEWDAVSWAFHKLPESHVESVTPDSTGAHK